MEKSYFVFECKSEQEYGEILAILAMHEMKPYQITNELFKLSTCKINGLSNDCDCHKSPKRCQSQTDDRHISSPIFADLSCANVKPHSYEGITERTEEQLLETKLEEQSEPESINCNVYENSKVADIYRNHNDQNDLENKQTEYKYESQIGLSLFSHDSQVISGKRKRRDATLKKFHEFILELLLDSRYEHLIHVSGSPTNNFIQFTIPDRRKFATVWGIERGDPNYSSTSLVNKDFWNAQKAEIFTRVLFQDPMLVYKIEPKAEGRFSRILSEKNLTMTAILQYCRERIKQRGNI